MPASPTFYTLGHVALPQQRGTGALNLRVFTGGDESITTPRLQWPNGQDHLVGRGTGFGQPISDSVCQVHLKLTVLGEAALARLRGKIHRGSRSAAATQDLRLTHDFVGLHRIGQDRVRLAMVWAAFRGCLGCRNQVWWQGFAKLSTDIIDGIGVLLRAAAYMPRSNSVSTASLSLRTLRSITESGFEGCATE